MIPFQIAEPGEVTFVKVMLADLDRRCIPPALVRARDDRDRRLAPPDSFRPVEGRDRLQVMAGRHPGVVANSSAEIGGVPTATLMFEGNPDAQPLAAVALHEIFHVFQGARHAGWVANEADLFL